MVMIITLIFRIRNEDLGGEVIRLLGLTADHHFYSKVLEVLLVFTTLPIIVVLAKPSSAERAQRAISSLAKKNPISLEQVAVTPEARKRIRVAAITVMRQSTISRALSRAVSNNTSPTVALICQQIDERAGEPTGTLKPGELIGWWVTAEPAQFTPDGQSVVPYSRANSLREALTEMELQPGDELDFEDVSMLLEHLIETEHERISDASIGKSSVLLIPP